MANTLKHSSKTSTNIRVVQRKKGGNKYGRTKKKKIGENSEENFRRLPLAEFGADAARSFADHTTVVSGTGVRSRRCRSRSESRRSSAGYS